MMAVETELVGQVRDALASDDPSYAASTTKAAVAKALSKLDQRVRVLGTNHFNHTWIPDLVLEWPQEPNRPERPVFLRLNAYQTDTARDLDSLGSQHPILCELARTDERGDDAERVEWETIAERSRASGSLVTDPAGMGRVAVSRGDTPVQPLFASALVRGGRGVLHQEDAEAAVRTVSGGYEGAARLDRGAVADAARVAQSLLSPIEVTRVAGLLQAVWIGSGGEVTDLPTDVVALGELDSEALQFLIDTDEIENPGFWESLGRFLDLDRVRRLAVGDYSANLQHLIRPVAAALSAKICQVAEDQPRLSIDTPDFYWIVERNLLALRGVDFTAYVASIAEHMTIKEGDHPGARLGDLLERAEKHNFGLTDVELTQGDNTLAFRSETDADITENPTLSEVAATFGDDARVRRATTTMSAGRDLHIDFPARRTTGMTSAQFPVSELVRRSIHALLDLDEELAIELEGAVPRPPPLAAAQHPGDDQLSLRVHEAEPE